MCIADLDHFEQINDTYGHDAGDRVLVHIAEIIRRALRQQDVTARCGGAEILLLLPDTGLDGALVAMEKVRSAVSSAYAVWKGARINATMTVGIARVSADMSVNDAIRAADQALYRGKDEGRNRVVAGRSGSASVPG